MLINDFKNWDKFGYLWLFLSLFSTLSISLYKNDSCLSIISALINIVCLNLIINKKISNFFWGAIGVLLYGYLTFINKIYGETILYIFFYFPMKFVGYYNWKKNKQTEIINSKTLTFSQYFFIFPIFFIIILSSYILKIFNDKFPIIDSTTVTFSILSMILMTLQYKEQWIGWIIVNTLSIFMWYNIGTNNIAQLLMWIIFLLNSLIGFYRWSLK